MNIIVYDGGNGKEDVHNLSTINDLEMPKNRVMHEVIHVIHRKRAVFDCSFSV